MCRRCRHTCSKHKTYIWELSLQLLDRQAGRSRLAPGSHEILCLVALCRQHPNGCNGCNRRNKCKTNRLATLLATQLND